MHTKSAGSRFSERFVYHTHSPDISGKRKNKDSRRDSTAFTAVFRKKKVYIAIGDEETIVANLWEKYRDLSYLCRWGRKKDKQICQEEELGISKLWLSIDNIKKLEKYREKTLGELERLDRENGSEYIRILKCYLETNGNIGEVATECFLHRNTVSYHLKKSQKLQEKNLTLPKIEVTGIWHIRLMNFWD